MKTTDLKVFREGYKSYDELNNRKLREILRNKDEEIINLHKELTSKCNNPQKTSDNNGGVPMCIVTLVEPGKKPRQILAENLLGTSVKVYLKGRATDYEAFYFKPTAISVSDFGYFFDGYDDERINLRIALTDIDYVIKGGVK